MIAINHLRHAHLPEPELRKIFLDIIWQAPVIRDTLTHAQDLALPNWRIVSGALYNVVWNHLTDRPAMHGVKDIDLMYFDPDTSWQAEDTIIRNATGFPTNPPVEIRNQARVHLWYEQHFGHKIPPLTSVEEAIDVFACKTHSVGVRLENDTLDLYAPYGLCDIFAMRVVPNPIRDNRATHETKAKRALQMWPELTIIAWPQ
ncbi:MAG: nucleotidyltransferase family protein [Alphaproteobacteria bacterium]